MVISLKLRLFNVLYNFDISFVDIYLVLSNGKGAYKEQPKQVKGDLIGIGTSYTCPKRG